jgi:hypothetical protein
VEKENKRMKETYDKEGINNVAFEVKVAGGVSRQTRIYKTKIRSLQKCLAASKLNIDCDGKEFNLHNFLHFLHFLHFPHFKSPINCFVFPLRLFKNIPKGIV